MSKISFRQLLIVSMIFMFTITGGGVKLPWVKIQDGSDDWASVCIPAPHIIHPTHKPHKWAIIDGNLVPIYGGKK